MERRFCPIHEDHRSEILEIVSYYMVNSFSAVREEPIGSDYFDFLLTLTESYPTVVCVDEYDQVLGFAFLRAYHPAPTVQQTAIVTIFVKPGLTGRGIGSGIMNQLLIQAREEGIANILADILSPNKESVEFHKKHGFKLCGQYSNIGVKLGQSFDMLLMQRQE